MSRSVKGKSAVVTGAGSGINLEFARVLLKNGCNVLIGDIALRPEAQKLVDEYSSGTNGPKAVFKKTDVTSWDDLSSMFKAAEKHFGTYPPGSEQSQDDPAGGRYKTFDINLVHPVRSTQIAISHFLSATPAASADHPKTVVLIASIASEVSFIPATLYCTSKWAIRGFIYSMGELEESRNIRVAGVAPAIVRTPLWLDAEEKRRMVSSEDGTEQTDWTTPEEVAEVMLKLCTDNEITNSNGDVIPLKGGSLIEVVNDDVRDVPLFGNLPPGSGTKGKGLDMANAVEAWKEMNAVVSKPGWGES